MPPDIVLAGSPVLVEPGGEGVSLERVPLTSGVLGQFDEAWLQDLIHTTPACLPISEIEPGLGRFMPICREFRTPHGYIDNLLMAPAGDIALVETKLFRNPEARRLVLGKSSITPWPCSGWISLHSSRQSCAGSSARRQSRLLCTPACRGPSSHPRRSSSTRWSETYAAGGR
jgi:hypothetical protein